MFLSVLPLSAQLIKNLFPLDFQVQLKCIILSYINGLIRSPDARFLLLFNHFAPGSDPSPGRKQSEIMQPDNASRQSITLMAFTMMPLRFLTNFRLLQLSICTGGSQQEPHKEGKKLHVKPPKKSKGNACVLLLSCQHFINFTSCFRQLLSAVMKRTVLLLSSRQAIQILTSALPAHSLCSGSFDLFLSGCLRFHYFPCFFLLSLSLSFAIVHPPFSSHPTS